VVVAIISSTPGAAGRDRRSLNAPFCIPGLAKYSPLRSARRGFFLLPLREQTSNERYMPSFGRHTIRATAVRLTKEPGNVLSSNSKN